MKKLRSFSFVDRFVRFITFIDLPVNRKFTLFAIGVLFWLLALTGVAVFALVSIDSRYARIVEESIPHERIGQKIARDLDAALLEADGLLASRTTDEAGRHALLALDRLDEVRRYAGALALGGKSDKGGSESIATAPVIHRPDGRLFLQELDLRLPQIDSLLRHLDAQRRDELQSGREQSALQPQLGELGRLTGILSDQAGEFAVVSADITRRNLDAIQTIQRYAFIGMAAVLVVAITLLTVFTTWIADAIAAPIRAIIGQIKSLGIGEVDLSQKVAITSKDEIGTLSREFNELMETVYGMTAFKNVIEEDPGLPEIYGRLGALFSRTLGIRELCIYEIDDNQREMHPVYPDETPLQLHCRSEILSDCELCRARKTGHEVSSFAYPGVCLAFRPQSPGEEHICLPVNVGGRIGAVVQFRFVPPVESSLAQQTVAKAETFLRQSQPVMEAKRLLHALRDSALRDSLTGLYNRRFLQDHTQQILAGARRRKETIGLLMCDLDYFKQVNDQYGHETGDLLLRETSATLARTVRESDYVIRFGGEEFLILLLDIDEENALSVAEKLRAAVAAARVSTPTGPLAKTISIGMSVFPADTESFWQAIKYADVALYRAKDEGRNRVVRFLPEMWERDAF